MARSRFSCPNHRIHTLAFAAAQVEEVEEVVEVEEEKRCYCSEAVNAAGEGVAEAAACFAWVEPFDIGNGCPYSWDVAGVA